MYDHYDILGLLGAGAGGVVHHAHDRTLDRAVVIKTLHESAAADPASRDKLIREARLAASIDHPNVCAIYDVGDVDGVPFIVMPHLAGRTLRQVLENRPLSLHFVLSIGAQVADGLAAAHALGVVHGDLKPSNILLTEDGRAIILDFGLARMEAASETEAVSLAGLEIQAQGVGTTAYMAPEMFVTRAGSRKADLFALGVILYEALTGEHPFLGATGMDPMRIAASIRGHEPPRPASLRDETPDSLDALITTAMSKDPEARTQSASEIREILKGVIRERQMESGFLPGEVSSFLPPLPAAPPRSNRMLAGLSELLRLNRAPIADRNSVAVMPFQDMDGVDEKRLFGFALADAVATRLAEWPEMVIRPPSAVLTLSGSPMGPIDAARKLLSERVLFGTYTRCSEGFEVRWQLIDTESSALVSSGSVVTPALELAVLQRVVSDELFAALQESRTLPLLPEAFLAAEEHPRERKAA